MAKKQSLGRGFDTLMPTELDKSILEEDTHRVQKILIQDIVPNPDQPRRGFDKKALNELVLSVKRHGVLQPIIVVRQGKNYRIVAGERRWRAASNAGLKDIPAIVRSMEELEEIEVSLIENIQREDLSPLEQALAVFKLQQQFNLALDTIAQKLGKAPSTLSNLTRLLQLPEPAEQALKEQRISEGHARAIVSLRGNTAKQEELLRYILNNGWTVRQAEQFAAAAKKGATSEKARTRTDSETATTKLLSQKMGSRVSIRRLANGGKIEIPFKNDNELAEILKRLHKLE